MHTTPVDELGYARDTFLSRATKPGYENAHERTAAIFAAFFPNGIELKTPDDFARFQFFSLCVSKMNRYAGSMESGKPHYDSVHDLIGYAATLAAFTER